MGGIILFDGVCNLCNSSVQFLLKRDIKGYFQFASLQGKIGQELLGNHGIKPDVNSFVLIENDHYFVKSSAAIRVCKHLKGPWKMFVLFLIIPPFIRDFFYNIVAENRYKWFGKRDSCMLPLPEWKERFLDKNEVTK